MEQLQQANRVLISRLNRELSQEKGKKEKTSASPATPQAQDISPMLDVNSVPIPSHTPASSARKKPKKTVKPVSYDEKRKLGVAINRLPPDALPNMLKLVQELGAVSGEGDEVELDLDRLDDAGLRELMKYVAKCMAKRFHTT